MVNRKKVVSVFALALTAVASIATAVAGVVVSNPVTAGIVTATAVASVDAVTHDASALTLSGAKVIVETEDVELAQSASGDYAFTLFQSLKYLGVMALIAGSTYIVGKVFGILPGGKGA